MRPLIISFQTGGVSYYRAHLAAEEMRRMGLDPYVITGLDELDMPLDKWLLEYVKDFDVIHAGYTTNIAVIEYLVAARNYAKIPLIVDIDDDINRVPTYNIAFKAYHGGSKARKVARFSLKVADCVSVSTEALKQALTGTAAPMTVLPNCINESDWEYAEGPQNDATTIMFAGNIGRYGDLLEVKGAISSIMAKYPQVRLYFLGCLPDWAEQWLLSKTDPTANRAFFIRGCGVEIYRPILRYLNPDIFIAPVQENAFNKAKSQIKAYDAAMINADLICSDWETYASIPQNCALKISGEYEWKEALEHSIEHTSGRKTRALNLRNWALTDWAITKHIHKWLDLYDEVISAGPILSVRSALERFDNGSRLDHNQQQNTVRSARTDNEGSASIRSAG